MADASRQQLTHYLDLYKYLLVLTEAQLLKLRNVAIGILHLSAFTPSELDELERHLQRGV